MRILLLFILASSLFGCAKEKKNKTLKLPSLFSDHMVLQRNDSVSFWGESESGSKVLIKTSWGNNAEVISNESGNWKVNVSTPDAGGPYKIEISISDTTVILNDVLIGEVWLASGQSNMEMPLKGWPPNDTINFSNEEIAKANYPQIRMFTVEKAVSGTLVNDVNGSWKITTPESATDFSATAYFFARELYKQLNIPVGIIHSSWGGTPAESWVSKSGLKNLGDFNEVLDRIDASQKEQKKITAWLEQMPVIDLTGKTGDDAWQNLDLKDDKGATSDFNDSNWEKINLPVIWERTSLGEFDGVIWFRKEIKIDQEPAGKFKISLGPIDDMDLTYVNGVQVGGFVKDGYWQTDRVYDIPEGALKKGKNIIAVKVIDTRGGGGIWGKPDQLYLENNTGIKIDLSGEWKFLPIAEYINSKLFLYGMESSKFKEKPHSSLTITAYTPGALFNAMISPLTSYNIRGAIWYQGESNVGRGEQYERLFPALIKDWRQEWGNDFPFYFVQIAPFAYENDQKEQSPKLREAQRLTLSVPNTGMAVTMDIGKNNNIHPGNKQDVGRRLALWALGDTYGKELVYSGPLYAKLNIEGDKIIIYFDHAGKVLTHKGKTLTGFELAGVDGIFYSAKAKIKDSTVVAFSEKVKSPISVRYAWRDTSEATLFNAEGLPASSFQSK